MRPFKAAPAAASAAVSRWVRSAAIAAVAVPAANLPSAERREILVFMVCSDGLSDGPNIHPVVESESNSNRLAPLGRWGVVIKSGERKRHNGGRGTQLRSNTVAQGVSPGNRSEKG